METILQKYEFRTIRLEEAEQAAEIERIVFRQMKRVLMSTWQHA